MPDAENTFKRRPRSVVAQNMEPIFPDCNDPTIRGVMPYRGEEYLEEDLEDSVKDNWQIFSGRRGAATTRGMGTSTFQSIRGRDLRRIEHPTGPHQHHAAHSTTQSQRNVGRLTEVRDESRGGSSDSDRPLLSHAQGTVTEAMNITPKPTSTNFTLNNTPLSELHQVKYLEVARRDFVDLRPPFVRASNSKKETPRTVILTNANGSLSHPELVVNLVTREWNQKYSFYTIDRGGERLIVKPVGGRCDLGDRAGSQYRTWSDQGKIFDVTPVAYAIHDDAQELLSHRQDTENVLRSKPDDVPLQHSDSLGNGGTRVAIDAPRDEPRPASPIRSSLPHAAPTKTSIDAPKTSETAAGKRRASDHHIDDDISKRLRHDHVIPIINNPIISTATVARVPANLTEYKQERTILFVPRWGSKSDVIPIKLSSAMTIPSFFSSVCAAAGIVAGEDLGIAMMLEPQDDGQERNIFLRRDTIQAFEWFLESVDEAECWKQEGGSLSFWLQLKWTFGP